MTNPTQIIDFCELRLEDNSLRVSDYRADIKILIKALKKQFKKQKKGGGHLQLSLDFESSEMNAKMFMVEKGLIQKDKDDLSINFENGLKVNLSQLLESYYKERNEKN